MKNILGSLPARLLLGVIAGILVGLYANEALMQVILTLKNFPFQIRNPSNIIAIK